MSDYLPTEVIIDIFKRLPVKSVVKCRSVCKSWNSIICDPSFISTHFQASLSIPFNNTPFLLIRCLKNGKENYSLHYDNYGFDEFKQLQCPAFECVSHSMYLGCCNGLICLGSDSHGDMDFVFWNPSIRKYVSLPQPTIGCINYVSPLNSAFGFGFDSRTNDYKLIIVGVYKGDILFSLNENCWKRVAAISPNYAVSNDTSPIFVHGAVHWLGYQCQRRNNLRFTNKILGFDLSAEDFFEISLPESLIGCFYKDLSIMKYRESSIAVLSKDLVDGKLHELWVMKEYGVVESWTKVLTYHVVNQSREYRGILGFRNNGEVLLQVGDGEMASLDLNSQLTELHRVKIRTGLLSVGSYVESLMLLDKAVDVRNASDVNHAIYSSGSVESSGGRVKRHRTGP
ncbi:F-box protein CPR1-like [Hibiscus syriacus]|uniref:F-box protein CPR1-like n=1 Tax=Hibiscus syriacus TaxID=106335 RepID=UPI0019216DEB|nr:F-box protein CPR1-like [Hibiscus syriacus]